MMIDDTIHPDFSPRLTNDEVTLSRPLKAESQSRNFVTCTHCALPVPSGSIDPDGNAQFCCLGCQVAYEIIRDCELDAFYKIRDKIDGDLMPVKDLNRQYAEMDDSVFRDLYVSRGEADWLSVVFHLDGLHCAACVWLLEKLPKIVKGVVSAQVNLRRRTVRVSWIDEAVELSTIAQTLASLGYPPQPITGSAERQVICREERQHLIRIAVAGACAGNVMLIAVALYAGVFSGMAWEHKSLFRWASLGVGATALVFPGRPFFLGALAAIRTRTPHMDLPVALGLGVGGLAGLINTFVGRGDIYFDSICVLIFLLLLGRWVQFRQQRQADDAVRLLYEVAPSVARRVEGEGTVEVLVESLKAGDVVEVRAGETVPVDGVVAIGSSSIDKSLLTGESRACPVSEGDGVSAGTINLLSIIQVKVDRVGQESRVGQLMQLIEEATLKRTPLVLLADRIGAVFVVVVIGLALLTFSSWLFIDSSRAVANSIALLIVACPCALGLATPLAIAVAVGRCAKRNILVKGGDVFERLVVPGQVWLDKTGTLTDGAVVLQEWKGTPELKTIAAEIEKHSNHPIAKAFVNATVTETSDRASDVKQTTSGGISGTVDERNYVIGSQAFLKRVGVDLSPSVRQEAEEMSARGLSPILMSRDGVVVAMAGMAHQICVDANDSIEEIKRMGWQVGILSGDHPEIVRRLAVQLGIPLEMAHGDMTPERKLRVVEQSKKRGAVVMVGDGVNDSASLAAASVGIAVKDGAEVSLAVAPVYLTRQGLGGVVELLRASRRTVSSIHRNFAVSLAYNVFAVALAGLGLINPLVAALLMPVSSLSVVALTLTQKTFGRPT